jgi:uncharacterized membrane protein required for colicin V production
MLSQHWVDLIFILVFLVAIVKGWRAGFLASIFTAIGFLGGGVGGLYFGLHYLHRWTSGVGKFGLLLVIVSIGSWLGEVLLKKVAAIFHNRLLFGPFKWADSLLGAAFSLLRTVVMALIVAHLLLITPWSWAQKSVPTSVIYKKLNSYSPAIISEITKKAQSIK